MQERRLEVPMFCKQIRCKTSQTRKAYTRKTFEPPARFSVGCKRPKRSANIAELLRAQEGATCSLKRRQRLATLYFVSRSAVVPAITSCYFIVSGRMDSIRVAKVGTPTSCPQVAVTEGIFTGRGRVMHKGRQ